jgi:hypothetical protein
VGDLVAGPGWLVQEECRKSTVGVEMQRDTREPCSPPLSINDGKSLLRTVQLDRAQEGSERIFSSLARVRGEASH